MDIIIEDDKKTIRTPETIHDNLFFEMKIFYGLVITAYIAAGVLIVVG
ncbi:hypothetical protein HOC35_06995 [Candidatus Woesearchaeota archaeon]|jgi:hypothetical protein|nr:hypothetical protein [Candidatus Woesearchaeota archaeon]